VTAPGARLEAALFAPTAAVPVAVFRVMLAAVLVPAFWRVERLRPLGDGAAAIDRLYASIVFTSEYWWMAMALVVLFGAGVRPRATGLLAVAALLPLALVWGRQQSRLVLLFTLLAFAFLRSDAALALGGTAGARALGPGPMWPILLIRLQLSLLYGVNALAKTTPAYLGGDVLGGLSLMLSNFHVDLSAGSVQIGGVPVPVPWLSAGIVAAEYALALGFWVRRLRWPTAVLGTLFHLAAMQVVTIGFLHVASVFLYTAFLLPFEAADRERRADGVAELRSPGLG
jgi:hypothetical protein